MRIATVDSASSILNENLLPTNILSMAGIIVDYPYKQPSYITTKDKEYSLTDYAVLINELKLCEEILAVEKADYVHLDLTLGGINILELKEEDLLYKIPLSNEGRTILRLILPELQNIARSIKEKYNIPVLAIGKKSLPVRLAELYAAAYGVVKAISKARETKSSIYLGLPVRTTAEISDGKIRISSQEPMETDLFAEVTTANSASIEPFHNPIVRGFQTIKITPEV